MRSVRASGNYLVLTIQSALPTNELQLGESIACDGSCLTVTKIHPDAFTVEASQETVQRTIVHTYGAGSRINLERAMQLGGRLGGHLVSGHIDVTGRLERSGPVGNSLELAVTFDSRFDPLVIEKGSIAINGVSLTINETRSGWFTVNIIPHTAGATTLEDLSPGSPVNLEFDMIGKYVLKSQHATGNNSLTIDKLKESGW